MKRLLIFSSIVLVVTACGAPGSGSPATPTLIPSVPTAAPPTSTAVASASTAAIPPTSGSLLGAYDNNKTPHDLETLTLLDGGRYILQVHGDDIPIPGTWTVSAQQIAFTETAGGGDCPGDPGTYKFVMDGKALTFTKVQDPYCDLRVEDFPSGPWIKKP